MAHFACVCPPFIGHVDPMAAVARKLAERGHRVTFLHMADAAPLIAARGFDFAPLGRASHPPGARATLVACSSRVRGLWGVRPLLRQMAGVTDMLCRELPDALAAIGADLVLCDQLEAAGGLVSRKLGLPMVSVAASLPQNFEAGTPPALTPFAYGPGFWRRERNIGAMLAIERLFAPVHAVVQEHAQAWGMGERRLLEDCWSDYAQITQLVPSLDFPREMAPTIFHYVGPLRLTGSPYRDFVMPPRDARRLAYVSLGSQFGDRLPLLAKLTRAALDLGLQTLVTHGGRLPQAGEQALRALGADVFAFAPQEVVFAQASIAVTHGGVNTVLDALAAGVPLAILPLAFDQGAMSARAIRAGVGAALSPRLLSSRRARAAMRRALEEPAFADAAARVAREIADGGGARRAADIVEQVMATKGPVFAQPRGPAR